MDTVSNLIASRLKRLRKSKGMKQAELAEAMGCEINTISRYETGANKPTVDHLLKMAQALGVSPMEILPPPDPLTQVVMALREDLAERANQLNSPVDLKKLVNIADELIAANRTVKK